MPALSRTCRCILLANGTYDLGLGDINALIERLEIFTPAFLPSADQRLKALFRWTLV